MGSLPGSDGMDIPATWARQVGVVGGGEGREEGVPSSDRPASKVPPYLWRSRDANCRVREFLRLAQLATRARDQ